MKKTVNIDEFKDILEQYLINSRQAMAPSKVLMEIQNNIKAMQEQIAQIAEQTKKTNGRVTDLERWKLILTTALVVSIATKYPQIASFLGNL